MGLSQALSAAVSGLRVTQSGLSLVAGNVANASTPGYVRKTATQLTTIVGDFGIGVRATAVNRELDVYTQRQLRVESSGGNYADVKADFYSRLQDIYGQPGSSTALETVFNNFTGALQALGASPDASAARGGVLNAAQVLAQQLNGMSADIQSLRTDTEQALGDSVNQANTALQQIARLNQQLASSDTQDAAAAGLLDQRDAYIDQLSTLMDVRVVSADRNQVNIFTSSGTQLVGTGAGAATLKFDAKGTLTPDSQWNADPTKRSVGTISLISAAGGAVDLVANGTFRSGKIAAYLEMRDQVLPQAQGQLDQIASAMSRALSDKTTAGSAITVGPRSGFDVDIGSLLAGNTADLSYTDTSTGQQHKVTIVRVDDPSALPLKDTSTAKAGDKVVGVYFGNGLASVVSQLNSALAQTGLQFSNPAGTTLRALDDGSTNRIDISAMSTTVTQTSLINGGPEMPLFTDGLAPFSGAVGPNGGQTLGFAARIAVNASLIADPSKLVAYQSSTAAGDATRPNFLLDRLSNASFDYAPQAGVGTTVAPFNGTVGSYIRQMTSQQGEAANAADSLKQGQDIVVNTLQQRFSDESDVNIDQEMTKLLNLQTAYGANARVMTTVRDMLDMLLKM